MRNFCYPVRFRAQAGGYLVMSRDLPELAKRMAVDEKEARRILDPRSGTKVPTLERALAALGKRAALSVD